jgi:hypothetical protein
MAAPTDSRIAEMKDYLKAFTPSPVAKKMGTDTEIPSGMF